MKKSAVVGLLVFAALGVGAAANAQGAKYKILMSNVMFLSSEKLVLSPLKKGGEPVTVKIAKDTKFYDDDGRTEIPWNRLKKGDEVTVTCLNEPTLPAVKVRKGFHVEI
jgi:hypothetical protein